MSLIRWNPTRELSWPSDRWSMQREMNRMFDNFFRGEVQDDGSYGLSLWTPAADIAEHDNEYVVKVELPGMNKDDLNVTFESNVLTIRGEKKQEKDEKKEQYHRLERSYGAFQRSFTLPGTVKNDTIAAAFKDGILTIRVPKAEEARPKQIEIKVK